MMNLHNIVRGAIQSNLPDEEFTLYRSIGQVNNDEGIMTASYSQGETIKGNFQSTAVYTIVCLLRTPVIRKLYVYKPGRQGGRGGQIMGECMTAHVRATT